MSSKCKIILIADTHKDLVTFYSSYLEKHFDIRLLYKINKASLKQEIKNLSPDLVIVDMGMDTMIDLVQEIIKEYNVPVCVYSDEFVSTSKISSRPHGIEIFDDYGQNVKALHKSEIKPENLSRELDKIIKGVV